YEYKIADNDETFDKGEAESWEAEAARFDAIMTEWREVLSSADKSKLKELAPPNNEMKWSKLIANINAHNAHHGGQIVLLRKLQGSWNPRGGVS
ncbi:MAG TPA: DinB family protein, partial [Pyrinomonadaceae bacterium]|nr:DinB family protein [Pyrinomonadaceae bacterium]